MIRVVLHGPITDRFPAEHTFAIRNPREAVALLNANYPGFWQEFSKHDRWHVVADDDLRDGDSAAFLPVSRELHFYPQAEGNAFLAAAAVTAITGITGTAATIIGGLLFAGVMVGLSFLIKPKKPKDEPADAKNESYAFTGPENVTEQGVAVPLIYGRCMVGSVVISAGLEVVEAAI
jgi:predicted phage tail protein